MDQYFLDTEFIETFTTTGGLFSKRRKMHTIDLISIGIVSNDGREYFAISSDYDYSSASDWVKENVIRPLYIKTVNGDARNYITEANFHKQYGLSNRLIKHQILEFTHCYRDGLFYRNDKSPKFYGYYSDYDWVLFCSLFGRMIDLPKGFPMYCIDVKQELDQVAADKLLNTGFWRSKGIGISPLTVKQAIEVIKTFPGYPQDYGHHDALGDAKWVQELYRFIAKIS